jgi:hypothetical protein
MYQGSMNCPIVHPLYDWLLTDIFVTVELQIVDRQARKQWMRLFLWSSMGIRTLVRHSTIQSWTLCSDDRNVNVGTEMYGCIWIVFIWIMAVVWCYLIIFGVHGEGSRTKSAGEGQWLLYVSKAKPKWPKACLGGVVSPKYAMGPNLCVGWRSLRLWVSVLSAPFLPISLCWHCHFL